MPSDIDIFVLSAPGRAATTAECLGSIEASDIGRDYTLCTNLPGVPALQHWQQTFAKMTQSPAPMVVLFEDDCLVNQHTLWNLRTWEWVHHQDFGAGWLFNPGGYHADHDSWYDRDEWYGTVGVAYWRDDLPHLLPVALKYMADRKHESWDCAIAYAIHWVGLKIRVHGPPLCEHLWDPKKYPSLLGHTHNYAYSSTRDGFKRDFRREPPRDGMREMQRPWRKF